MRRPTAAAIIAFAAVLLSGFGTINGGSQSAEHEKITRLALACHGAASDGTCLEPATLDEFAGKKGTFGAIGYPDSSKAIFQSQAHCDDGDVPGGLEACRTWMNDHLNAAVKDAEPLLRNRWLDPAQTNLRGGCVWFLNFHGRAKCNVLQDLGIAMHASQDFYAHSNWVDAPTADPPGLGMTGPAPFISLRAFPPRPAGLISGCFSMWGQCGRRISHAQLNKDTGPIDGDAIGPGDTPHGAYFAAAVRAAIADSQDKFALWRERVLAAYGPRNGAGVICAITHDDPATTCPPPPANYE